MDYSFGCYVAADALSRGTAPDVRIVEAVFFVSGTAGWAEGDSSARLQNATVITIPNSSPSCSFQRHVTDVLASGSASDLAFPGDSLRPFCADAIHAHMYRWTLLPWTSNNAPDIN